MAEPQKKPSNEGEPRPDFGAILPDKSGDNVGDFLHEFDNYQQKLDEEWEKSKAAHQDKLNKIMEEYIHQKMEEKPPVSEKQPEKKPAPKPAEDLPQGSFQERMEGLLARVERELGQSGKTRPFSFFEDIRPTIINVPSRSIAAFFKKLFVILSLTAILGSIGYMFFLYPLTLGSQTPLPYSHASGILKHGNQLYVADWFRKALYVHSFKRDLPIVAVENIPNSFITGLAVSEKNLWTLDGFENKILRHTITEDHQVVEKYPAPGSKPAGAFWDGFDLWTADNQTKLLYQHKITDIETPFNQYRFPNMTVTSFFLDNNRVWALDGETRELFVLRLQDPLKVLATYDLDSFLKGAFPTGVALNQKSVLLTTNKPSRIIKISIKDLQK